MPSDLRDAFSLEDVELVAEVLQAAEAKLLGQFDAAFVDALRGSFDAVSTLASGWELLLGHLLEAAHASSASAQPHPELRAVLRMYLAEAPFTRFSGVLGARGMAVACVARVREAFPEFTTLSPPAGKIGGLVPGVDVARFHRLVDLATRGLAPPLERVQESLGLTDGELGRLFGVSRQAVLQWKRRGVPSERWDRLADVIAVVDLLDRKLKQGRLPLIARRPAAAFGGRTLLEMVAAGHHAELREIVERSLDWSSAA